MNQRGDTLVEVLLATVVISVVIAGAYTLTNRATRLNQLSFERTTAVNQMREQIEYIRGMQIGARNDAGWASLTSYFSSTNPVYDNCIPTATGKPFYADPTQPYDTSAAVNTYSAGNDAYPDFYDVWVEAYKPSGQNYIDFHVRACWQGAGGSGEQRAALVLRMAE